MDKYWELTIELPNQENEKVINDFLSSLITKKKKTTLVEYRRRLQKFFKEREEHFSTLTPINIEDWLAIQRERGEQTRQKYTTALLSFYKFCLMEGYIKSLPINTIRKKQYNDYEYWVLDRLLPNHENKNVINEYLLSLKKEGKSRHRILLDRQKLQLFFRDREKAFSSITSEDIQQWVDQNKKWSKQTIQSYVSILRSFYFFCLQKKYIEDSPLKKNRWKKCAENYWEVQQPIINQENYRVISEYLLSLKEKNYTQKTVTEHRFALQSFFRERELEFYSIKQVDIQQWITQRQTNGKLKTVLNYVSFIRSFYRYCVKQGYMQHIPVQYHWESDTNKDRYWLLKKRLLNEENHKVINEYLLSMKVTNLSEGTIKKHRYILSRFFIDREETYDTLSPEVIQEWILTQHNVLKESTVVSYLGSISSFYNFCVEEGYIEKSPIKSRWFPRLPRPIPKYLERKELATVRMQTEKENLRDRLIVEFLLVSGCRVGEIHKLNKTDMNLENRTAHVLGKGQKIRAVHFTKKCAFLLEQYLKCRDDNSPALFVSSWGKRVGIRQLQRIVENIGKRANLNGTLHPHRFRHTFATELLVKGADVLFIADELGHVNVDTTLIYANLPNQEIVSMYRKYMC
ncbi:site-specific integrase [Alkalihalophilus marmarensis]|uniref:tyrosine-type recombinase/integrase n=1 Tax=Alkalihalophilus marmarensis TaxID=521377 RepID=UPI00203F074E|nr:tyrosine-type recombinase/integrase [Alkalihalophilus marmarensis]MCM3491779.1 site-specific integrase [Alkalihalophilus marmarensis]